MTAKVHDNGEARKERYNEMIGLIQLCPEHWHFQSLSTFVEVNHSAFRSEEYQWIFSTIIDQRLFRTVAVLG